MPEAVKRQDDDKVSTACTRRNRTIPLPYLKAM